jgi:hypothetical protein
MALGGVLRRRAPQRRLPDARRSPTRGCRRAQALDRTRLTGVRGRAAIRIARPSLRARSLERVEPEPTPRADVPDHPERPQSPAELRERGCLSVAHIAAFVVPAWREPRSELRSALGAEEQSRRQERRQRPSRPRRRMRALALLRDAASDRATDRQAPGQESSLIAVGLDLLRVDTQRLQVADRVRCFTACFPRRCRGLVATSDVLLIPGPQRRPDLVAVAHEFSRDRQILPWRDGRLVGHPVYRMP